MLAYEILWAFVNHKERGIKESTLKKWFKSCTPSETLDALDEMPKQNDLLSSANGDEIKSEVEQFLAQSSDGGSATFSVVVNKNSWYPKNLKDEYPIGLFYCKGDLHILGTSCVSIVGARKASPDGIKSAWHLAKALTDENYTIVSGLAMGIDTAAHRSAIKNEGKTIGVIGTPINQCYPTENRALQDKIAENFLLISQVPFYKFAHENFKLRRFHFFRRNKIMASISKATIVVEASDSSGSLVQAKECLRQNKKLFILDSCFRNPENEWPFDYEKKGAIRVRETAEILNNIQGASDGWYKLKEHDCWVGARGEYISGADYREPMNSLILDFKKSPLKKHKGWEYYRERAIKQFKEDIESLLGSYPKIVLTAVPESRRRGDPEYTQRFEDLFQEILRSHPKWIVEWPVEIKETTESSHNSGQRDPDLLRENYIWKGFEHGEPEVLHIFDDIITTGAHLRAVSDFLRSHNYKGKIIGVCWAKTRLAQRGASR